MHGDAYLWSRQAQSASPMVVRSLTSNEFPVTFLHHKLEIQLRYDFDIYDRLAPTFSPQIQITVTVAS